jgi:hypothetical protein
MSEINVNRKAARGIAIIAPDLPENATALQFAKKAQKKTRLGSDMGASIPPQRAQFRNRGANRKNELSNAPTPKRTPNIVFSICMSLLR